MSSRIARRTVRGGLLGQMLDDPQLVPQLRALPVPVLRQAILQIGLEDSGELIALASLEQLRGLFDEDLWRSPRPGLDEDFDGSRFAVWLEVLLEAGEAFVADRLAELSEDFLAFAVSQVARVLDTTEVAASIADADEAGLLDKVLDAQLCQELDEYLVVSRLEHGWDAVWASLLALDERHGDLLRAIFHRCWLATRERADEAGGLYSLLGDEEMLREDARAERDDRRAERGHVSAADARAFLALAGQPTDPPGPDPISRAYFRDLRRTEAEVAPAPSSSFPPRSAPLRQILAEAGLDPVPEAAAAAQGSLLRESVAGLLATDPDIHQRIVEELAFLANVLVAGDVSHEWRPVDAAEEVLRLCEEGLRATLDRREGDDAGAAREVLVREGAVGLFRAAWAASRGRR